MPHPRAAEVGLIGNIAAQWLIPLQTSTPIRQKRPRSMEGDGSNEEGSQKKRIVEVDASHELRKQMNELKVSMNWQMRRIREDAALKQRELEKQLVRESLPERDMILTRREQAEKDDQIGLLVRRLTGKVFTNDSNALLQANVIG